MLEIVLILVAVIAIAVCGFNVYIFTRPRRVLRNPSSCDETTFNVGLGGLRNDGDAIRNQLVKGIHQFSQITYLMSQFQSGVDRFCCKQSQELKSFQQLWKGCVDLLILVDEQMHDPKNGSESAKPLIEWTIRHIEQEFEGMGIRRFTPVVGEVFDGTRHKSLECRYDDSPHGSIVSVLGSGFEIRSNGMTKILRSAEVVVSLGKEPVPQPEETPVTLSTEPEILVENILPHETETSHEKFPVGSNDIPEQPYEGPTHDEMIKTETENENQPTVAGENHGTRNRN
jgi:hypothetical protein